MVQFRQCTLDRGERGHFLCPEAGEDAVFCRGGGAVVWCMYECEFDGTPCDHVIAPARVSRGYQALAGKDSLWQEFMADDGFQYTALSAALTSNDDDARQLERVTLVDREQHLTDLY